MTPSPSSSPGSPSTYGPERRALLACIGRFGLAKTTLDDVAREAGLLAGHALPLLRRQARDRAPRGRRRARAHRRASWSTPRRGAPTFADAVVARRRHRGARARAATTRCSSCSRTSPRRCSATSRSAPATACSIAVGDAHRAGVRPLARPTPTRPAPATGWRASCAPTCSCPNPPIDLTDPAAARAFLEQFVIPGLERKQEAMTADHSEHHRSRRHQRPRRDPRRSPTPTSTRSCTRCSADADAIFTWDYERSRARAREALREGEDVAVERATDLDWTIEVDQEKVVVAQPGARTAIGDGRWT